MLGVGVIVFVLIDYDGVICGIFGLCSFDLSVFD